MLPDLYKKNMQELLGEEYVLYENTFDKPAYKGLRINTAKIDIDTFLKKFPYKLEPISWTADGFYYEDDKLTKDPYYYAGLFYIQEPSAMLPAEYLPIEKEDVVLDACAAPGGKSLKLLNKLNDSGILVANDISSSRAMGLLRNIERQGFSNFVVMAEDVLRLSDKYQSYFDKILLDAPCSGEGMFRKDKSLIRSWEKNNSEYYAPLQKKLLEAAISMLKPGGVLLYSTCTFSIKEDEEVIQETLDKHDDICIAKLKLYPGFRRGINDIGVKLFPHLVKGEGHFACLLEKKGPKTNNKKSTHNDRFSFINKQLHDGTLKNIKEKLYYVPDINTDDLRVLRSGLYLGDMIKDRFEPSSALALSLKINEFENVIDLKRNDPRVLKYLKGETIKIEAKDGYVLLAVDSMPVGFGKINNTVFKNKIDKGWIYR